MVQSTKKSLKEQPVDALVTLYAIACDPNCSLSDKSSFSRSLGLRETAIRHLEELQATYRVNGITVNPFVVEIHLFE